MKVALVARQKHLCPERTGLVVAAEEGLDAEYPRTMPTRSAGLPDRLLRRNVPVLIRRRRAALAFRPYHRDEALRPGVAEPGRDDVRAPLGRAAAPGIEDVQIEATLT